MSAHSNGNGKSPPPGLGGRGRFEDPATQAVRRLAVQLDFDLETETGGKSVMLTTAAPSAASASAALELATFMGSAQGRRVLIIDGDPSKFGLARRLGHDKARGLNDFIASGSTDPEGFIVKLGPGVALLPAGSPERAAAAIQRDHVIAALKRLVQDYDYILVQCGPVLDDPTAMIFASVVDCALLLIVEGKTRLEDMESAKNALVACRVKRMALVLTVAPSRFRTKPRIR